MRGEYDSRVGRGNIQRDSPVLYGMQLRGTVLMTHKNLGSNFDDFLQEQFPYQECDYYKPTFTGFEGCPGLAVNGCGIRCHGCPYRLTNVIEALVLKYAVEGVMGCG